MILSDVTLVLLYLGILQSEFTTKYLFFIVFRYLCVCSIQMGQGYFYERKKKYGSVFRVNMGVKGVHICDKTGIKVLFHMDKVGKSKVFVCH